VTAGRRSSLLAEANAANGSTERTPYDPVPEVAAVLAAFDATELAAEATTCMVRPDGSVDAGLVVAMAQLTRCGRCQGIGQGKRRGSVSGP
jgi:hypothetical protein